MCCGGRRGAHQSDDGAGYECRAARNDPGMRRFIVIITAAALLAVLTVVVIVGSPPPENVGAGSSRDSEVTSAPASPASQPAEAPSTSAAARRSATPPAVRLRKLPATYGQPLYVTSPPGNPARLFVVEKTGRIRIFTHGHVLSHPFLDLSRQVSHDGEQGLLSMAFDPHYARNGRFYVDYTNANGNTRVVRYRVSRSNPNRADPSSARIILRIHQPYPNHNGGQLQFGPNGRLFVGMGDGGSEGDPQHHAQDPRSRLGKLLSINVNVSPVRVNLYARGLRNPWRFSFDRKTGALWIGDVGQNRREEVDYLPPRHPAGANFGWNGYEGTLVFNAHAAASLNKSTLTWPVSQYSHDPGSAITGGYVYRGAAIASLRGYYVFGDFGSGQVWAKRGPRGAAHLLPGADGRVTQLSSFGQDAAGELYVVSLAGSVYKIVPR